MSHLFQRWSSFNPTDLWLLVKRARTNLRNSRIHSSLTQAAKLLKESRIWVRQRKSYLRPPVTTRITWRSKFSSTSSPRQLLYFNISPWKTKTAGRGAPLVLRVVFNGAVTGRLSCPPQLWLPKHRLNKPQSKISRECMITARSLITMDSKKLFSARDRRVRDDLWCKETRVLALWSKWFTPHL